MTTRIAIDCMGGDHGPSVTVPAAIQFLAEHPSANLLLVGQEDVLRPLLATHASDSRIRLVHASEVVGMDESPAQGLTGLRFVRHCLRLMVTHTCLIWAPMSIAGRSICCNLE